MKWYEMIFEIIDVRSQPSFGGTCKRAVGQQRTDQGPVGSRKDSLSELDGFGNQ